MLPCDANVYITMHMDLPEYRDFDTLRRFADKHVKVMTSLERQRKGVRAAPVRLVEAYGGQVEGDEGQDDNAEGAEEDFVYPALDGLDVEQQLKV